MNLSVIKFRGKVGTEDRVAKIKASFRMQRLTKMFLLLNL